MSTGEWRLTRNWSISKALQASNRFIPPSELREMRGREQVAAVCYRVRNRKTEFLLVQTRGGRWTFPKGSAEPGLTHAQAAALEAFEEAGVHGRMEEASFARYVRCKRTTGRRAGTVEFIVHAHLCEVLWLAAPQEANRNPSWFSPEKAKRRLREDRKGTDGAEFARVVDRAVMRIQQIRTNGPVTIDGLQKVEISAERRRRKVTRNRPFLVVQKTKTIGKL
jgi:8-oxo-dGTP pyrophosphatase MutT (NUDIX family)